METNKKEHQKRYFTPKGIKALYERLNSLIQIYNTGQFPFKANCWGFRNFDFKTREDCLNEAIVIANLLLEDITILTAICTTENNDKVVLKRIKID